jgi:hypothetical protein
MTSSWTDPYEGAEPGANSLSRPTIVKCHSLKFLQWCCWRFIFWDVTLHQLKIVTGFKESEWRLGDPSKHQYLYASGAGTVTRLQAGQSTVRILDASRPAVGPSQACYLVGSRALSSGVKRPGCEADHSPPSNAKVQPTTGTFKRTQVLNEDRGFKYLCTLFPLPFWGIITKGFYFLLI